MNLLVLVNDVDAIEPEQTTALLLDAAARRGWTTRVTDIDALALLPDDRVACRARTWTPGGPAQRDDATVDLATVDVTLVRTNPARSGQLGAVHQAALVLLAMVVDAGGLVLNDPTGLMRASSKLYLAALPPAFRPETLVTRDRQALIAFVRDRPYRCVLKPLSGTRGQDVFFVQRDATPNLPQIVDVLVRQGVAMAQAWVPEATAGDTRIVLVDGEPLAVDGALAIVRRVPGQGELRSNVAQGGAAAPADVRAPALAIAAALGPRLRADGMFLAGIDVIGDKAVEINVYSPGGLLDAGAFEGVDFVGAILDAVAGRVAARRA